MINGVAVNMEKLAKKYEVDLDMARCFAQFFSTSFIGPIENEITKLDPIIEEDFD